MPQTGAGASVTLQVEGRISTGGEQSCSHSGNCASGSIKKIKSNSFI